MSARSLPKLRKTLSALLRKGRSVFLFQRWIAWTQ